MIIVKQGFGALAVAASLLWATTAGAGTLFVGADVEDFDGGLPSGSGMDRLGVVTTTGASVDSSLIIVTDFLLNGMADAGGELITGTPLTNTLRTVDFDGTSTGTLSAAIPDGSCCNEEMLFVPLGGGGSTFYHAKFGAAGGIREIDLSDGSLVQFWALSDVVGMALVNGDIWITRWSSKEIGIWDPSDGSFDVEFDLDILGLAGLGNAGALAWDPGEEVLWLGTQGGRITPFDLDGNQLGDSYLPFGSMSQTIDGLTFLGEVTGRDVPEPGVLGLFGFGLMGLGIARRRRSIK